MQVESAAQKRLRGTGLGLSLSKKLAHVLGGDVGVTSVIGKALSSRSPFRCPSPDISHRRRRSNEDPRGSRMSSKPDTLVLVVDDNPATRYATSRVLRAAGHTVLTAASGLEAISAAVAERPDVVALDINLPDIDGFRVCRELRARPETRDTPVLLSATFTDDLDKVQGPTPVPTGTSPIRWNHLCWCRPSARCFARRAEHAVRESEARFKAVRTRYERHRAAQ